LAEIQAAFGMEIIGGDSRLRRGELARIVFADPAARKRLEEILHPKIARLWQDQVRQWRAEGHPYGVVVIPLLYETNLAANFDAVVCVACTARTQRTRLQARGLNPVQIRQRIEAQWMMEKKMELADYVVWTEGSLETHGAQLRRILP
jgi:dephospho-CoA kinase